MKLKIKTIINYFKQRRVWAAGLSSFALYASMAGHEWVIPICTIIATSLCLHSYHKPKK